jgi:hypothetical protein
MPDVTIGFSGSNGMPFLLQVISARSSVCSPALPVVHFLGPQIHQHQMAVRAARNDRKAVLNQSRRQRLRVVQRALRVELELRLQRFVELTPLWRRSRA